MDFRCVSRSASHNPKPTSRLPEKGAVEPSAAAARGGKSRLSGVNGIRNSRLIARVGNAAQAMALHSR